MRKSNGGPKAPLSDKFKWTAAMAFTAAQFAAIDARILEGMDQTNIHAKIDDRVKLGMKELEEKMKIELQSLTQAAAVARGTADSAVSRLDATQAITEIKFNELKGEQQLILDNLMLGITRTAEETQRKADEGLASLKELSRQADESSRASLQALEQARLAQMQEIAKVQTSAAESNARLEQIKTEVGAYVVGKQEEIKTQADEKQGVVQKMFENGEKNIQGMQQKYNGEMKELEDKVKFSLNELQRSLRESLVSAAGDRSKGGFNSDGTRQSQLIDTKSMHLATLPEEITVGEFKAWRKKLDLHLENFVEFKGFKQLLARVRNYDLDPNEMDPTTKDELNKNGKPETGIQIHMVCSFAELVRKEELDTTKRNLFENFAAEVHQRADELYRFLHAILSKKMIMHASRIKDLNGFELYRLVSQKMDPCNRHTTGLMLREVRAMQGDRAKNIKETVKIIQKLEVWRDEYVDKVGKSPDPEEMSLVLWQTMDDKTHDSCINKGFEQFDTTYEEVTRFVLTQVRKGEEREVLRRPANRDKDGDVQMFNLAKQDAENPSDDSEGKGSGEYDEEDWEWYHNILDAFKGKGGWKDKGAGKGDKGKAGWEPRRLVFNECHGFDHPERICPSKPGVSGYDVSKKTHKCPKCGGQGHVESACVAKSKTEYLAEKAKAAAARPSDAPGTQSRPQQWSNRWNKGGGKADGRSNLFAGKGAQGRGAYALAPGSGPGGGAAAAAPAPQSNIRQLSMFARAPAIKTQVNDENEVKEWNPDVGFVKVTRFTKGAKNNQKARRE